MLVDNLRHVTVLLQIVDVARHSEPEKVEAERRAMEEAAEVERKAIAKREAAKERARKRAEEKKRIEDENNSSSEVPAMRGAMPLPSASRQPRPEAWSKQAHQPCGYGCV